MARKTERTGITPKVFWKHVAGGCGLSDDSRFPCDDEFVSPSRKQTVTVRSSYNTHFSMPDKATLEDLRAIPGVKVDRPKPNKYGYE